MVTYDQLWWPILGICALRLTHPKCTHTAVNTHTHCEHTPGAVGSHFCCGARGAVGGSWYWRWGALCIHSPHLQLLLARGLNSQSFDYESDSLTIRPRLPQSEFTAEHWRTQNDTHLVEYSVAASHRRRRYAAAPRSPLGRRGWAQWSWGPGWGLEGPWCRWVEGRWWRGCRETSGCWP